MKTVLVGMSGGVDSSVSAIKLLKEGCNVVGATLSMGRGCDISAIVDAKIVCEKLGIEHHVIDVSYNFKNKVIDYFVNSYLNGETPNPCSVCNRTVKFQEMINFMKTWCEGIIVAVMISIIIELLIPEGNNKKYVKRNVIRRTI